MELTAAFQQIPGAADRLNSLPWGMPGSWPRDHSEPIGGCHCRGAGGEGTSTGPKPDWNPLFAIILFNITYSPVCLAEWQLEPFSGMKLPFPLKPAEWPKLRHH